MPSLQSKDKESSTFRVKTEVDYTTTIDPKPKMEELYNTGNAEEKPCCKNRGKKLLKSENQKMERQIIHLKKSYISLKKRKRIPPLRQI